MMQPNSPTTFLLRFRSPGIAPRRGEAVASRYADQSHPKDVFGDITTELEDFKAHRSRQGRVLGLLLDVCLILLPVPLVVMVPPVMACRHIETNVGFYAGESFRTCARDGIAKRWALLDSRIKMMVRQSGR